MKNEPQPQAPNTTPQPISKLDILRKKMEENRSQHVSDIFEIYDKIPTLLAEFKDEGISEDVMVRRLGKMIDMVFASYEVSQVPLVFDTIKEKNQLRALDEKISNASSIVTPDGLPAAVVTKMDAGSRIIMP